MKPYIEAELHEIINNIKATTDVKDMTFGEIYSLFKEKIKDRGVPVYLHWSPDESMLYILDISEFNKPIKLVFDHSSLLELGGDYARKI